MSITALLKAKDSELTPAISIILLSKTTHPKIYIWWLKLLHINSVSCAFSGCKLSTSSSPCTHSLSLRINVLPSIFKRSLDVLIAATYFPSIFPVGIRYSDPSILIINVEIFNCLRLIHLKYFLELWNSYFLFLFRADIFCILILFLDS